MSADIIWEVMKIALVPILLGVVAWLWKLDRRHYDIIRDQLMVQVHNEQRFVSKESFEKVISRLEVTMRDGFASMRSELLDMLRRPPEPRQ